MKGRARLNSHTTQNFLMVSYTCWRNYITCIKFRQHSILKSTLCTCMPLLALHCNSMCVWLYMWAHMCTLLMTDDFLPLGLADKIQTEADINGRRLQPLQTIHKWIFDLAHTPRPCNCNSACCPGDGQGCSSINTPWLCAPFLSLFPDLQN